MNKTLFKIISKPLLLNEITLEASDTYTYKFDLPKGLTWTAGSNLHLLPSDLKDDISIGKKTVHHLSIMSLPSEGYLGITTRIRKEASVFKKKLLEAQPGDTMRFFGIKNHLPLKEESDPVVLISMGVGIATMRPLMLSYTSAPSLIPHITSINVDNSGEFIYQSELQTMNSTHLKNVFTSSRTEMKDAITTTFGHKNTRYYIVGSDLFISDTAQFLIDHSIAPHQIYFDKHQKDIDKLFKNITTK